MAMKPSKSKRRRNSSHQQQEHKSQRNETSELKQDKGWTEEVKQSTHHHGAESRLFPGNTAIWMTLLVTLVTLVLRVRYVRQERTWWILHPDEIYQSLEVAFSELHGYGHRTYEFLAPSTRSDNLSLYQQRAQQLGMYALRSPLFPRFYTAIGWMAQWVGCTCTPYLVWRTAHVVVSSMLPLAVHVFAAAVFRSRDVGAVAAILVASSVHLGVLGAHTLVHSLLAPVIFAALAVFVSLLNHPQTNQGNQDALDTGQSQQDNAHRSKVEPTSAAKTHTCLHCSPKPRPSPKRKEEKLHISYHQGMDDVCPASVFSVLSRFVNFIKKQVMVLNVLEVVPQFGILIPTFAVSDERTSEIARIDATNSSLPERNVLSSSSSTRRASSIDVTSSNASKNDPQNASHFGRMDDMMTNGRTVVSDREVSPAHTSKKKSRESKESRVSTLKSSACGFALALCCYIRPDGVLLMLLFLFPYIPQLVLLVLHERKTLFSLFMGGCFGILLGIFDDFYFYGVGLISPYNWFRFNVMSSVTSQFFGAEPSLMYLHDFVLKNEGMRILLFVNFAVIVLHWVKQSKPHEKDSFRSVLKLLTTVLVLFGVYSLQPHKELRFIHHVMVFYFALSAANIVSIAAAQKNVFGKIFSTFLTFTLLLTFAYSQWKDWPIPQNDSFKTWVYNPALDNYDVNRCVTFIASQTDVRGVFSDKNLHSIGGFTFLRHNVPVLTLTFAGYVEYGMSSRVEVFSSNWLGTQKNISLLTTDTISNFFSARNKQYLVRHLINRDEYNYLVMDAKTEFLKVGYQEMSTCGEVKVVKRIGSDAEEKRLREIIPHLKLTAEVAVLEKEARELYAFGLKDLAASRYGEAQRLKRLQG